MTQPTDRASPALVIAAHGRRCVVRPGGGARTSEPPLPCKVLRKAGRPVCGDRVLIQDAGEEGVVEAIEDRRNYFPRADRQGRQQIVAANLDRIVIVVAPEPLPTRDLINRYLVACESLAIPALICLNKCDLLDSDTRPDWAARLALYEALGYPVVRTRCDRHDGVVPLREAIARGVSILVGQSGVGKSSLVNALVPDLSLKTQAISRATGKGRHTTTACTLYDVDPGRGAIIDSPGVWEYGIWQMSPTEVAAGFRDFQPYLGQCRFGNCSHVHEPDCAIAAAAEDGRIDPQRLDSYRRIVAAAGRDAAS